MEFNDFFEKIHPGRPFNPSDDARYGRGWYNVWRDAYSTSHGTKARKALQGIIDTYYPSDQTTPATAPTTAPTTKATTKATPCPSVQDICDGNAQCRAGCPCLGGTVTCAAKTTSPRTVPPSGQKRLFMIAGQSNAEGNVDTEGLKKVADAFAQLPAGTTSSSSLTANQRAALRSAIKGSQGNMCGNPNPYKDTDGDALIDRLFGLKLGWRKLAEDGWEDSRVQIRSANFAHSAVTLGDRSLLAGLQGGGDGVPDADYCAAKCLQHNPPLPWHCHGVQCGTTAKLNCGQACMFRRRGLPKAKCIEQCDVSKCEFDFVGLSSNSCGRCQKPGCTGDSCGCAWPSSSQCKWACNNAAGKSGLAVDFSLPSVDNGACALTKDTAVRLGPFLSRYSPTGSQSLRAGFGTSTTNGYGPELAFGACMADRTGGSQGLDIVKVAMGGSNLGDHWRTGGTLYSQLVADTKAALAETGDVLGGLVWFQGYNDQSPWAKGVFCNELWAEYKDNLVALVTDLRKELGVEFPVVVVKANHVVDNSIHAAQVAAVAELSNAKATESKGMSSCFHYDAGTQVVIGEEAADAMAELLAAAGGPPDVCTQTCAQRKRRGKRPLR